MSSINPKRLTRKQKQENTVLTEDISTTTNIPHKKDEHGDVLDLLLKSDISNNNFFPEEPIHYEGQLAIDMIETGGELMVVSTIAGADTKSLSINVNADVLTIRGKRESPIEARAQEYLYKECYWGWFSRTIVLPVDVRSDDAKAEFHNGVLVVKMQKQNRVREVPIRIIEE